MVTRERRTQLFGRDRWCVERSEERLVVGRLQCGLILRRDRRYHRLITALIVASGSNLDIVGR